MRRKNRFTITRWAQSGEALVGEGVAGEESHQGAPGLIRSSGREDGVRVDER